MRCATCDADNPAGGLFCIECGASLRAVASGATTRLPNGAGLICGACDAANPNHASFCVNCGRPLQPQRQTVATMTAAPPLLIPEPTQLAQSRRAKRKQRRRNKEAEGAITGGVFLIGLAILFATNSIWPGILVLCGIASFLSGRISGEPRANLFGGIFLIGMAILFATGTFWPGILILCGVAAICAPLLKK